MKRILLAPLALGIMLAAWKFTQGGGNSAAVTPEGLTIEVNGRNPWTHLRLNNDPEKFQFLVVSDRTGGHRARIFSQAVEQINMLQPEFVLSVGDLIEGYTKDKARLANEWKEFQGYVAKLKMPFFYVPGNHDLSNTTEVEEWKERFGRSYYHFLYRNVLFLCLATDDQGEDKEYGQISMEQVEYFKKVLAENKGVRWIIVSLHKPVWSMAKFEQNNFQLIEKELAGRNYTVFAGHVHRYQKFVRNGMNYYQLATTGGGSRMRGVDYREFDHVTWVTMGKEGPVVANILLDGILPDDLKRPVTTEEGVAQLNRKPVQPVKGKLFLDGAPMAGAKVTFLLHDEKSKKYSMVADAFVDSDGTFTLTSYKAGDGAPVGEYLVTVVWRDPYYDDVGLPGRNKGPLKYTDPKTTDLRASVKLGGADLEFNLTR